MGSSIKNRLVKNFMLIIIITVLIFSLSLMKGIRSYFFKNIEDLLTNQLNFSIDYMSKYLSVNDIEDIIIDDIDLFWNQTTSQIQVFNKDGELIMDSLGLTLENNKPADVEKALNGEKGLFIGNNSYYDNDVMSISKAIERNGKILGVLRFTTSMRETKELINSIDISISIISGIVIIISGLVALFLSDGIVKPLEKLTLVAEKMAAGDMKIRSDIKLDDEIGRLSETLNYMAEELVKKEEMKNEFVSSISHELKTPLTSIKGWALTLQGEEMERSLIMKEGLSIIVEESDRLSIILEELLDFSSFVSGEIILRKEKININYLLEGVYKQVLPRFKSKKINFKLISEDKNSYIMIDKDRLRQVLLNILDNSFKFTDGKGKVSIISKVIKGRLYISIEDNGVGIERESIPYIKEKFYTEKKINSNTGIGLAISNEIINLHEGELNIYSEKNKGTRVEIILPLGDENENK